jgi:hypothetical protein
MGTDEKGSLARTAMEDYRTAYKGLTDEQLAELTLDADDLGEQAKQALRDEVRLRGTEKMSALAQQMELEGYRTWCEQMTDYELKVYATSGECRKLWQGAELNRQLQARGVDGVEAVLGSEASEMSDAKKPGEDMVTVARFNDPTEAQLAKAMLDSSTIESFLAGENANNMVSVLSTQLMVRRADEEAARAILEEFAAHPLTEEESDGV